MKIKIDDTILSRLCRFIKLLYFCAFLLCLELIAEPLDVETLAHLRTRQYSQHLYDKIVVFSSPRTGSSLAFNVFRFLFEEDRCLSYPHNEFWLDRSVLRTHKVPEINDLINKNRNVLYVVPIRDPLQTCISRCRIRSKPIRDIPKFCRDTIRKQVNFFSLIENLKNAGLPVIVLKFEEMEKRQCDYLIDIIQTHFSLSIDERDVQTLKAGYSRENIYDNIRYLEGFKEFLPLSGFHGKHVCLEPFIPSEELLYWFKYYFNEVKPFFQKYGYSIDM